MHTCVGPGCEREPVAKNLCKAHHQQDKRRGFLTPLLPPRRPSNQPAECIEAHCKRRPVARNLCFSHYAQVNYVGAPLGPLNPRTSRRDFPEHCTGPDCKREVSRAGLCTAHAAQKYRRGFLTPIRAYNRRVEAQEGA